VACGKHFPGHGDTTTDSHLELPVVASSFERLHDMELRPFRHAIDNELATIMTAHVSYPKIDPQFPATLSYIMLTDLLRDQLRFKGVVITDDLEMRAIIDHYGIEEAALLAFQAGADVLLICKERDRQVAARQRVAHAEHRGDREQEGAALRPARAIGHMIAGEPIAGLIGRRRVAGVRRGDERQDGVAGVPGQLGQPHGELGLVAQQAHRAQRLEAERVREAAGRKGRVGELPQQRIAHQNRK